MHRLYIVGLLGEHGPSFEFPFIPDLQLRCGDVLEDDLELEAQGVIEAYTLTDSQFRALRGNKLWQPSKLAWPDKTASTLNSHYSVGVSRAGTQLAPRPAPHNPRRFTPRECCRLMGFPEAWELGSPEPDQCFNAWFKSRYRMLGNAVCPPVVAALGGAVLGMCPGIAGFYACPDWRDAGCTAAIRLAIEALPRVRRSQLLSRLHSSFSTMDAR